jgi:hypothetical protein
LVERGEIEDFQFSLTPENCPHLTAEQIAEQIRDVLPSERPQRIHGHWEGITPDRLLDQFSDEWAPAGNLLPEDWWPKTSVSIAFTWDHGEGGGKEHGVLWAYWRARHPDGSARVRAAVLDEYRATKGTTIAEDACGALDTLARAGVPLERVDVWLGDVNSAGKGGTRVGASVNDLLAEAIRAEEAKRRGVDVDQVESVRFETAEKGPGSVDFGTRLVNVACGNRDLFFKANAKRTVYSVKHWKGTDAGEDGKLKHAMDAVRYGAVAIFGSVERYSRLRIRYGTQAA